VAGAGGVVAAAVGTGTGLVQALPQVFSVYVPVPSPLSLIQEVPEHLYLIVEVQQQVLPVEQVYNPELK